MTLESIRHFVSSGPFASTDHTVAGWFSHHLSGSLVQLMLALSGPGSGLWIGIVLALGTAYLVWRRRWYGLLALVLMVPGGLAVNSIVKIIVHRHRPLLHGALPHWSGYSFPSGHTIGATLLYGMIVMALIPLLQRRRWKALAIAGTVLMVMLVGFSRIALQAHFLSDVIGAIVLGSIWLGLCRVGLALIRRYHESLRPEPSPVIGRIMPQDDDDAPTPRLAA